MSGVSAGAASASTSFASVPPHGPGSIADEDLKFPRDDVLSSIDDVNDHPPPAEQGMASRRDWNAQGLESTTGIPPRVAAEPPADHPDPKAAPVTPTVGVEQPFSLIGTSGRQLPDERWARYIGPAWEHGRAWSYSASSRAPTKRHLWGGVTCAVHSIPVGSAVAPYGHSVEVMRSWNTEELTKEVRRLLDASHAAIQQLEFAKRHEVHHEAAAQPSSPSTPSPVRRVKDYVRSLTDRLRHSPDRDGHQYDVPLRPEAPPGLPLSPFAPRQHDGSPTSSGGTSSPPVSNHAGGKNVLVGRVRY